MILVALLIVAAAVSKTQRLPSDIRALGTAAAVILIFLLLARVLPS